ncbi:class I adenylate-forming enzyme family protein [Methylobacter luteus]|uniref:class I adenylate-forming enzyme family protein n=1 Tax=Methylobacter luteus TaxID=415 RepID=UPI000427B363|nr:class I adenylate-forming enzyme family protein [Methylobacter luteus]
MVELVSQSGTPWSYGQKGYMERLIDVDTIPKMLLGLQAEQLHDQPSLTWYSEGSAKRSWNYAQLIHRVNAYAADISTRLGVSHGDRVLVISANSPFVFLTHLAIMSLGAITVPVGPNESPAVLRHIAKLVSPKLALLSSQTDDALLQQLDVEGIPKHTITSLNENPPSERREPPPVNPDDVAVIIFTSGTTSAPKGVTLSHYNLLSNAEGLKRSHHLEPGHVHGCVLPLYHSNAFGFSMVTSMYARSHVVLFTDSIGPGLWAGLQDMKVNVVSLVPNIIHLLAKRKPSSRISETLKYVVSAAAPLPLRTLQEFEENVGIAIHQGYGLSECTNFATTIPHNINPALRQHLMYNWQVPSIGTPLYGTDVNVILPDGSPAKAEQEGEIVIQGHNIMKGYWSDPASSSAAFEGGVFHSGDLGFFVEYQDWKYFFITGRIKEIIIRNGECMSPLHIERELIGLSRIGAYAVCGFPNDYCGEEIGLYVHSDKDEAISEIEAMLSSCSSRYRPRMVVVGTQPVPTSVTGKVQRTKLKDFFAGGKSTFFGQPKIIRMKCAYEDL